jgi:hypothetical protein
MTKEANELYGSMPFHLVLVVCRLVFACHT